MGGDAPSRKAEDVMTTLLPFLSPLLAATSSGSSKTTSGGSSFLLFLIPLLVIAYFLIFRPQRQRARRQQQAGAAIEEGDLVSTIGGIVGRVVTLDGERAVLEVSPGVHIELLRQAIHRRIEAGQVPETGSDAGAMPGALGLATGASSGNGNGHIVAERDGHLGHADMHTDGDPGGDAAREEGA